MPQICDMGPIILLPFRRKACLGFLSPFKNPTASAGFEPANNVWNGVCQIQSTVSIRKDHLLCVSSSADIYGHVIMWIIDKYGMNSI
jgi:hypothetical protein